MQNQYIYYRDGEYLSHWEWIEPISRLGYHHPSLGGCCQERGELRAVQKLVDQWLGHKSVLYL